MKMYKNEHGAMVTEGTPEELIVWVKLNTKEKEKGFESLLDDIRSIPEAKESPEPKPPEK